MLRESLPEAVEAGGDAGEAGHQALAGTGDVDADEAVEAVHHAGVDPDLLVEKKAVLDVVSGHVQRADIHPDKVGAFQLADRKVRKILLKERQQSPIVAVQVLIQFLQPRLTLVVGAQNMRQNISTFLSKFPIIHSFNCKAPPHVLRTMRLCFIYFVNSCTYAATSLTALTMFAAGAASIST